MARAQIFTTDFTVAIVVFLFILLAAISIGGYTAERISLEESSNDLEILGRHAVSTLLLTQGIPSNWSHLENTSFSTVITLGLATNSSISGFNSTNKKNSLGLGNSGARILDISKLRRLEELNQNYYGDYKKLLGIRGPGYEFALNVSVWDGTNYKPTYAAGREPLQNATHIVSIYRFALIEDKWAQIQYRTWQRCTIAC